MCQPGSRAGAHTRRSNTGSTESLDWRFMTMLKIGHAISEDTAASVRPESRTHLDQHLARRAAVAIGLLSIVVIHALDVPGKMQELPYVAWMFIGLVVASLVVAEGLLRKDDLRLWLAAGALAASAVLGYAVSRTVGLPGDLGGDKGNWAEPLGLASLVVEGIVVLLVVGRLLTRRT